MALNPCVQSKSTDARDVVDASTRQPIIRQNIDEYIGECKNILLCIKSLISLRDTPFMEKWK
jgi:hypothetical protein